MPLDGTVDEQIGAVRAAMLAYGRADDPPMLVCEKMLALCASLEAGQTTLARALEETRTLKLADIRPELLRAVRQAIRELSQAAVKLWHWRRWAWVLGAATSAALVLGTCVWLVSSRVYYDLGAEESARWSAWCADPGHVTTTARGAFCMVPVNR